MKIPPNGQAIHVLNLDPCASDPGSENWRSIHSLKSRLGAALHLCAIVLGLSFLFPTPASAALTYRYYETGDLTVLPDFSTLTPVSLGTVNNVSFSPQARGNYVAFRYEGGVHITAAGTYTFFLNADDGSALYIDNSLVVDNDGSHSAIERSGGIYLTTGDHKVDVRYFQRTGAEVLSWSWQGPDTSGTKVAVPDSVLSSSLPANVPAGDVALQIPIQFNLPVFSPLCGYTVYESTNTQVPNANLDTPLYAPYGATQDSWWDNLVAELIQARVSTVALTTRGTWTTSPGDLTGPGNMNPRRLYQFVDAVNRAGVGSQIKISCMLDAPSVQETYNRLYGFPSGTTANMADNSTGVANQWQQVWWLRVIKPWFDTIPQSMWFLQNGHPRIETWALGYGWTNQEGNVSGMINYVSSQMQAAYGVTPVFVGACGDSTFDSNPLVIGFDPWFVPPDKPFQSVTSARTGYSAGTAVAGYVDPGFPSSQNWNRVIKRNKIDGSGVNGDTFRGALDAAVAANCNYTMLEGWTNYPESAGLYRCVNSLMNAWDYPSQYINILRPYVDLRTVTTRLEAEGCDEYFDTTTGNSGGSFLRTGEDLDVRSFVGAPAVTASSFLGNYPPAQGMDYSFLSKWISDAALPQWLQYDYGSGRSVAINTYHLTSAENAPERDPSAWALQGSNDGSTWATLDSRSGQTFAARLQTNTYTFANTTAYRYYRLNVTAAAAGPTTRLQVEDLRLQGGTVNGGGWAVTNTAANEWLAFYGISLSSGYYRFPIRYASTAAHTVRLTVDNIALPDVVLPSTGSMSTFQTAYLGAQSLGHGPHNLKLTFVDGGVDVDWLFVKKASPMVTFKSQSTNCFLTVELGGNNTFSSNRTTAANWEGFSVNSLSGGSGALYNGAVANLQGYVGYYVTAASGGGGALTDNQRLPGNPEKFTLVKVSGSAGSMIQTGDQVALKANDGFHYVTVVSGTTVNVSGTTIGPAQIFTVGLSPQ